LNKNSSLFNNKLKEYNLDEPVLEDIYLTLNNLFMSWGERNHREVEKSTKYLENMLMY